MGIIARLKDIKSEGLLLIIVFLYSLPLGLDSYKFIGLIFFLLALIFSRGSIKYKVKISLGLLFISFFSLFSFSSILWAHDTSLVLKSSFIWLMMAIVAIECGQHSVYEQATGLRYFERGVVLIFCISLVLHLIAVHLQISFDEAWNHFLAKNQHYTTSYLTMLFPFLLFYKSKNQFARFAKVISIVLLMNLIIITGTRGALMALLAILLIKVWSIWNLRVFIYSSIVAVSSILLIMNVSALQQVLSDTKLVKDYQIEIGDRLYLNDESLRQFKENMLSGVGGGNWPIDAYTTLIAHDSEFDLSTEFIKLGAHNLFTQILAELGIIGFILFVLGFSWIVVRTIQMKNLATSAYLAPFCCVVVYLILSIFYKSAQSTDGFFSGIQLLGFISLGLLTYGLKDHCKLWKIDNRILYGIYLFCLVWFGLSCFINENYRSIITKHDDEVNRVERLEDIYYPNIKERVHDVHLLPLVIAETHMNIKEENYEKAEYYYKEAIRVAHNDLGVKLSYSKFLVEQKGDFTNALSYLNQIIEIQPQHIEANSLLNRVRQ